MEVRFDSKDMVYYFFEYKDNMKQELDTCEKVIISYCHDLTNKLLGKYRRGREEHGANWQGIDCDKEIAEEVKDILNYHCIFNAQKWMIDDFFQKEKMRRLKDPLDKLRKPKK